MRILTLFHPSTVPSPLFGEWSLRHGHILDYALLGGGAIPGAIGVYDALALLGCPASEAGYLSLRDDLRLKELVVNFIGRERKVLGISVGARLLAECLGSSPAPPCPPEIGWYPVTPTQAGRSSGIFPGEAEHGFMAFHWHTLALECPPGAVPLASTPLSSCQIFSKGWAALGVQFHLECQWDCVKNMGLIETNFPAWQAGAVQSLKIIQSGRHHHKAMSRIFMSIFDRFFSS